MVYSTAFYEAIYAGLNEPSLVSFVGTFAPTLLGSESIYISRSSSSSSSLFYPFDRKNANHSQTQPLVENHLYTDILITSFDSIVRYTDPETR